MPNELFTAEIVFPLFNTVHGVVKQYISYVDSGVDIEM